MGDNFKVMIIAVKRGSKQHAELLRYVQPLNNSQSTHVMTELNPFYTEFNNGFFNGSSGEYFQNASGILKGMLENQEVVNLVLPTTRETCRETVFGTLSFPNQYPTAQMGYDVFAMVRVQSPLIKDISPEHLKHMARLLQVEGFRDPYFAMTGRIDESSGSPIEEVQLIFKISKFSAVKFTALIFALRIASFISDEWKGISIDTLRMTTFIRGALTAYDTITSKMESNQRSMFSNSIYGLDKITYLRQLVFLHSISETAIYTYFGAAPVGSVVGYQVDRVRKFLTLFNHEVYNYDPSHLARGLDIID